MYVCMYVCMSVRESRVYGDRLVELLASILGILSSGFWV